MVFGFRPESRSPSTGFPSEEQRKWLAARDKSCGIYKGWVSCLSDYYQKRIAELKKRA